MKRLFFFWVFLLLPLSVSAQKDVRHIHYYGEGEIQIPIRFNYPVTVIFDEFIQTVRWNPASDFLFTPEIDDEVKINNITFASKELNPRGYGFHLIVGNTKGHDYSMTLVGSEKPVPTTVYVHDERKKKEKIDFNKVKNLMHQQDAVMFQMLFAHKLEIGLKNFVMKYIKKQVERVGFREVIFESAIPRNIYLQKGRKKRIEVGIYSGKFMRCNRSPNQADKITTDWVKKKWPYQLHFSYERPGIVPPQKCIPLFVVSMRDKYYDDYVD